MSTSGNDNSSNNGAGGERRLVWPHPKNGAIKVTNDPAMFEILSRDNSLDGIILMPPEELRKHIAFQMREAFTSLVTHDYTPASRPVILSAAIRAENIARGLNQLPLQFYRVRPEIANMCESFVNTTAESFMLFISEDTNFFAHGRERTIPVLMTQWTVAGKGAVPEDQKILNDGEWGYFPVGAPLPLHGWNAKDTTLSMMLIPTGAEPSPETP